MPAARAGPCGDRQRRAHRLARQRLAQCVLRVYEGGPRHVQAHRLEQHLVAVGGAAEGAGARAMVGGAAFGDAAGDCDEGALHDNEDGSRM